MTSICHDGLSLGRKRYSNARPVLRTVEWHGIPVSIEIEAGDTKSGIDENGAAWKKTYSVPYGEFPSSMSLADGDGIDVYVAGTDQNARVYVVHQAKHDGRYDEDKVVIGASSAEEAERIYKDHGPEYGFISMDEMSPDQFKHGYMASNRIHV